LPGLAFLDSALEHETMGRFSYVAADPFGIFTVREGRAYWNGVPCEGKPLAALRNLLAAFKTERATDLAPFQGGAIGYFAYDFATVLDDAAVVAGRGPQAHFAFYDTILAFDHRRGRCHLIASGQPEGSAELRETRAGLRLKQFGDLLAQPAMRATLPDAPLDWRPNVTRAAYCAAVERVKEHIRAGDIYQANISQAFYAQLPEEFSTWGFYKNLRLKNPAPLAAYLACGERTIASTSPECFLTLHNRRVETRPIKGTIKRSLDQQEDLQLADRLMASAKDRAENIMIVDLLRNDLSKVCRPNTVEVEALCALESYANVHHLVSAVTGELRDGYDGLDLVAASFPGGSITGAPKLKAMEIIAQIEKDSRGVYCGAIGFLGFNGEMALNIAIRTVVMEAKKATLRVGGGVTLLSGADAEYEESLAKAERILSRGDGEVGAGA